MGRGDLNTLKTIQAHTKMGSKNCHDPPLAADVWFSLDLQQIYVFQSHPDQEPGNYCMFLSVCPIQFVVGQSFLFLWAIWTLKLLTFFVWKTWVDYPICQSFSYNFPFLMYFFKLLQDWTYILLLFAKWETDLNVFKPSPGDRHKLGQPKRGKWLDFKSIWANCGESYWMPLLMLLQWVCVLAAGLKLIAAKYKENTNHGLGPAAMYGTFEYGLLQYVFSVFHSRGMINILCITYSERSLCALFSFSFECIDTNSISHSSVTARICYKTEKRHIS